MGIAADVVREPPDEALHRADATVPAKIFRDATGITRAENAGTTPGIAIKPDDFMRSAMGTRNPSVKKIVSADGKKFLQLSANPWVFPGMNTVLVFLANLLTVAAFPAMSVSLLEVGASLCAVVIFGLAFSEYGKSRRRLPALDQRTRQRGNSEPLSAHALTGA